MLSSCLSDQITQSKMRLNLTASSENNMLKLYLIRAFKNAKKLDLIYGNELKSVVIKGMLDLNIISTNVDKN